LAACFLLAGTALASCERQSAEDIAVAKPPAPPGAATGSPAQGKSKGGKAPGFSCYRNIVNNSQCPWTVSVDSRRGNVWFGGVTCNQKSAEKAVASCNPENGPCLLQPTCSVPIQYTYTASVSSGTFTVTDQNGGTDNWNYLNEYTGYCPYISHSGSTGPVDLNDPADGDITFGGCAFNAVPKKTPNAL
jgi:hypothetical protein